MNNTKYLTSNNPILRKFAKDRYKLNDFHKWNIIKSSTKIPNPFEFVINLNLSHQNLNNLNTLYCGYLNCVNNQLINLPDLPYCKYLYCSNNQLTQLPNLPYCKILDCCYNIITSLPDLPNCEDLYCYNNQLNSLPNLSINCKIRK